MKFIYFFWAIGERGDPGLPGTGKFTFGNSCFELNKQLFSTFRFRWNTR